MHGPQISRVKSKHRIAQDILGFASKFLANDFCDFLTIELVYRTQHTEDKNIFSAVLGSASDRFDGCRCEWHTNMNDASLLCDLLHLVRIIKTNPPISQRAKVILI